MPESYAKQVSFQSSFESSEICTIDNVRRQRIPNSVRQHMWNLQLNGVHYNSSVKILIPLNFHYLRVRQNASCVLCSYYNWRFNNFTRDDDDDDADIMWQNNHCSCSLTGSTVCCHPGRHANWAKKLACVCVCVCVCVSVERWSCWEDLSVISWRRHPADCKLCWVEALRWCCFWRVDSTFVFSTCCQPTLLVAAHTRTHTHTHTHDCNGVCRERLVWPRGWSSLTSRDCEMAPANAVPIAGPFQHRWLCACYWCHFRVRDLTMIWVTSVELGQVSQRAGGV